MNKEKEFARRINEIHFPQNAFNNEEKDIRHEEFQAMVDVFLGKNYDKAKLAAVEQLQIEMHQEQAILGQKFMKGEIGRQEFLDATQKMMEKYFKGQEQILGVKDFKKLFKMSADQGVKGLMDAINFHLPN